MRCFPELLLHKSLRGFVEKADCREDMGKHCERLDDLDRKVQKNSFVLSAIIQYHNSIGEPLVKNVVKNAKFTAAFADTSAR